MQAAISASRISTRAMAASTRPDGVRGETAGWPAPAGDRDGLCWRHGGQGGRKWLTTRARAAAPSILRHRPFLLFWASRVLSTLCFQMLAVAVGWQLYALTGSALDLGLVGLVQFIPVLVLTLPAGHWADRGDRRAIVAGCQGLVALLAALLLLGSLQGWLGREAIFLLIGLVGCARAVEAPTMASLLPGLVPRASLPARRRLVGLGQPDGADPGAGAGRAAVPARPGGGLWHGGGPAAAGRAAAAAAIRAPRPVRAGRCRAAWRRC